MTSREKGAPQDSMKEVLDMVTEKLYGASSGPGGLLNSSYIDYMSTNANRKQKNSYSW